jgi:hypothetical protein
MSISELPASDAVDIKDGLAADVHNGKNASLDRIRDNEICVFRHGSGHL